MTHTDFPSDKKGYLKHLARTLEEPGTLAKLVLWIKLSCGRVPGFQFEHDHAVAGYVIDFYCPEIKLAIDIIPKGRDVEESQDQARISALEAHGIVMLTFTEDEIRNFTDDVLEHIQILATAFRRMSRTG